MKRKDAFRELFSPGKGGEGLPPLWHPFVLLAGMALVELTAGFFFSFWFAEQTRFARVPFRESWMFVAQLLFQGFMAHRLGLRPVWAYLGQVAVVGVLGGIFLVPVHFGLLGMRWLGYDTGFLAGVGLGAALMLMFLEHARRVAVFGFPKALSLTWLIFRMLLFFVIFRTASGV